MNSLTTSWRPIAIIVVIALLLSWRLVPVSLLALALAGGGAYLLYRGWQGWTGRGGGRVTYWRGRRVELDSPARADSGTMLSLAGGAAMLLFGLYLLMQRII
jgi:hypothetical protein